MQQRVRIVAVLAALAVCAWVAQVWFAEGVEGERAVLQPPTARDVGMQLDDDHGAPSTRAAESLEPSTPDVALGAEVPDEAWPPGVERVCLTGRVVDARGSPWPGATVWFAPERSTRRELERAERRAALYAVQPAADATRHPLHGLPRGTTGPDGRFEICGPRLGSGRPDASQGDPQVLVTAPGMAVQGHDATGFRGSTVDVGDLVLEHAAAGLTLRVVDERGAPLAGVEYRTYASGGQARADDDPVPAIAIGNGLLASSDANGRMTLDHAWPGGLYGALHKAGYEDQLLRVELRLGEVLDLGEFVLSRGGTLTGSLVDEGGAPVAGALVLGLHAERLQDAVDDEPGELDVAALLRVAAAQSPLRTHSDDDGRFVLGGIPAAMPAVAVVAMAEGRRPAHVPSATPGEALPPIVMHAEASLRVELRSEGSGAPLPDGRLLAFRRVRDSQRTPSGRLMGAFRGTWLPLGVTSDVVRDPGPLGTLLLASAPGHLPRRVEVEPCAPGEQRALTVSLPVGANVRGQVVDDLGAPVAGAQLRLTPLGDDGPRLQDEERVSDADGRFAFGAIPPARWQLDARCSGHVDLDDVEHERPPLDSTAAGEPLRIVLPRSARLPGRLLHADGSPAVARWVHAHAPNGAGASDGSGAGVGASVGAGTADVAETVGGGAGSVAADPVASARSDRDGHFAFRDLAPGAWLLRAGPGPPTPVEVQVGDNPPVELHLPPRIWLRGRTRSGDEPLARVRVQADRVLADDEAATSPAANALAAPTSTRSDHDGRFALALQEPGLYDVRLASREGPDVVRQVQVDAQAGGFLDVDFGTGRITGRVVSATGEPVDTAMQLLRVVRDDTTVDWTRLDAEGRFESWPLQPGAYRLRASPDGYLPLDHGPLELPPGGQLLDVRCELQPATRLSGSVRWSDGAPFEGYVHLRRSDGQEGYEVEELDEGELYDVTLAPGAWRLDLTTFWEPELGVGEGLRGEPGAELSFFARRDLRAEPLQALELEIVIPRPEDG